MHRGSADVESARGASQAWQAGRRKVATGRTLRPAGVVCVAGKPEAAPSPRAPRRRPPRPVTRNRPPPRFPRKLAPAEPAPSWKPTRDAAARLDAAGRLNAAGCLRECLAPKVKTPGARSSQPTRRWYVPPAQSFLAEIPAARFLVTRARSRVPSSPCSASPPSERRPRAAVRWGATTRASWGPERSSVSVRPRPAARNQPRPNC